MAPLGMALTAVGAAGVAGLGKAVSMAADFESQVALMGVAAGDAGVGLDVLHDAALQVGGDISLVGVTASGAADSITNLLKAGLSVEDVFGDMNKYMAGTAELGGVLRASIDLAAASELDMAAASRVVSVAMSQFGLDASEATRITDNFVQSADASQANVNHLADALVNVGPTAASFGWALEDVNTALAVLSGGGILGAEAGTALKSMMTGIMRDTPKVAAVLADLNVELYDQEDALKSLPQIMGELGTALDGVTEKQRNQAIQTLAGTFGMKAMNTLLAEGTEGWADMEVAIEGAATAAEVAEAKTNTLQGQMEALGGTIEAAGIAIGETFLDDLTGLSTWAVTVMDAFNDLTPAAKETVSNLLLIGTASSLAVGGLILLVPKIAATVTALGAFAAFTGFSTMLGSMAVGFGLVATGGSAAGLGFAAAAGGALALLAPLALLTGGTLLVTGALEKQADATFDAMGSYGDYLRMLREEGGSEAMMTALSEVDWEAQLPPPQIDTSQIDSLSDAQFRLSGASRNAFNNLIAVNTGIGEIPGVAGPAADAMEPLAQVMAGYAASLAAIDTGPSAMWQMLVDTADAAGWTAVQIEEAGKATGIFTEKDMAAYEAQVRFGGLLQAGIIDVAAYAGVTNALAVASGEHGAAASKQAEYVMDVAEATFKMNTRFGEVPNEVTTHVYAPELPRVYSLATNYMNTLLNIPKSVTTWLTVRRSGDVGGVSALPEPLAEITPAGLVAPASTSGNTWNGGININGSGNPQATAAAVMQALQDRGMFSRAALR